MTNLVNRVRARITFIVFMLGLVTACGGGSSNSGGPPPAPPVTIPTFSVGVYSGTIMLELMGEGITSAGPESGPFTLEVSGTTPGQQQVRIAFLQFSGTSSISPDGEFTISSGTFRVGQVRDQRGRLVTCTGQQTFTGTFSNTSVSGTATGPITCPGINISLTLSGTFQASLGSAKITGSGSSDLILGTINN